jgi:hypothetical protein
VSQVVERPAMSLWVISVAETSLQLFVDGFYQREFGLVQWARYAIAAIEY